jgi:hypothetical protein
MVYKNSVCTSQVKHVCAKNRNLLMLFREAIAALYENRLQDRQNAEFWYVIFGGT